MPERGIVTIGTGSLLIEDDKAASGQNGGRRVCARVIISDSGQGMDEETRERIFEPFFTTRKSGRVNGLGLSIVYGIVEQHGGRIDVSSVSGEGTEFSIYFPLMKESIGEADDGANSPGSEQK